MKKKYLNSLFCLGFLFAIIVLTSCDSQNKRSDRNQEEIKVNLPYNFKSRVAEKLSISAFNLNKNGHIDEAIDIYNKAIIIEHDNPKLFFDLANCFAKKEDFIKAIQLLDTAITLDPLDAMLYSNRGFYYLQIEPDDNAVNDYKKAIDLDAKNYIYHANLSMALYYMHKLPEACKELRLAKSLGLKLDNLKNSKDLENLERECQ